MTSPSITIAAMSDDRSNRAAREWESWERMMRDERDHTPHPGDDADLRDFALWVAGPDLRAAAAHRDMEGTDDPDLRREVNNSWQLVEDVCDYLHRSDYLSDSRKRSIRKAALASGY